MSAIIDKKTAWLNADFWELLERLEGRHRRAQSEYDSVRQRLDRADTRTGPEIQNAWIRYCEVIDELDQAAGDLERLRLSRI